MTDNRFTVEAGGTRLPLNATDGVEVTRSFRITAPGPTAAEVAAMQLLAATASRRREIVRAPWARVAETE